MNNGTDDDDDDDDNDTPVSVACAIVAGTLLATEDDVFDDNDDVDGDNSND